MPSIEIIKPLSAVLSSAAINLSNIQEKKFLGMPRLEPGGGLWVRRKNANSVLSSPPKIIGAFLFVLIEVK